MKHLHLVFALLLAIQIMIPLNSHAQGRVIKGENYWVLDQVKMTSADRAELTRLLGLLQDQDDYRLTIQTKKNISTYGDMALSDIQLINTAVNAENSNQRGFTLFHDCLYQHNGECTLVHEYVYSVEERAVSDPVSREIDALLEKYQ